MVYYQQGQGVVVSRCLTSSIELLFHMHISMWECVGLGDQISINEQSLVLKSGMAGVQSGLDAVRKVIGSQHSVSRMGLPVVA